jgi:hypothetical protein
LCHQFWWHEWRCFHPRQQIADKRQCRSRRGCHVADQVPGPEAASKPRSFIGEFVYYQMRVNVVRDVPVWPDMTGAVP